MPLGGHNAPKLSIDSPMTFDELPEPSSVTVKLTAHYFALEAVWCNIRRQGMRFRCASHIKRGWGFWTLDDQSLKPSLSSSSLNPSGYNPSSYNPSIISSNPKPSFRCFLYHPFKPSFPSVDVNQFIHLVNGTSHQASFIMKLH